jgi:hypothetical protein
MHIQVTDHPKGGKFPLAQANLTDPNCFRKVIDKRRVFYCFDEWRINPDFPQTIGKWIPRL